MTPKKPQKPIDFRKVDPKLIKKNCGCGKKKPK